MDEDIPDDLQLAWENLEVARQILIKQNIDKQTLHDIFISLGNI